MHTEWVGVGGSPLPGPLFQRREINSAGLKTLHSPRGVDPGFPTHDDDDIVHLLSTQYVPGTTLSLLREGRAGEWFWCRFQNQTGLVSNLGSPFPGCVTSENFLTLSDLLFLCKMGIPLPVSKCLIMMSCSKQRGNAPPMGDCGLHGDRDLIHLVYCNIPSIPLHMLFSFPPPHLCSCTFPPPGMPTPLFQSPSFFS